MKYYLIFLLTLQTSIFSSVNAQVSDDFSDGNFTDSPAWSGDIADFIINSDGQLQLNAPAEAGQSILTTESEIINNAEWSFYIKMEFNPSSSNYLDIYLVSDNEDLTQSLNGYFIRIGNTQDEVSLYKHSGEKSTAEKIIDGADDRVDLGQVELKVKVTKSASNQWELFVDPDLSGNYISEGIAIDDDHIFSRYYGLFCKYTSTRSTNFYFDDLNISGESYSDDVPPTIDTILVQSDSIIHIVFSESLDDDSALNLDNYFVNNGVGNPQNVSLLNDSTVDITFQNKFQDAVKNQISIHGVKDLFGNALLNNVTSFTYYAPYIVQLGDIIISEIFADPTPQVDLPESEFLELHNPSEQPFEVIDLHLVVGNDSVPVPAFTIDPGEYLILCKTSAVEDYIKFGKAIGIPNWPTLNNRGERIALYNASSDLLHEVDYLDSWYQSDEKEDGGWSLEMIDLEFPHLGFVNWKASIDESGGTPGRANSIKGKLTDFTGPLVIDLSVQSHNSLIINFNESLMDSTAGKPGNYVVNQGIGKAVQIIMDNDSIVILHFEKNFSEEFDYELTVSGIKDTNNNELSDTILHFNYQAPYVVQFGDLLITEIFADPNPQVDLPDYEFLELYNPTSEELFVFDMLLVVGEDSVILPDFYINPDEYLILCQSAAYEQFVSFGNVLSIPNWPTLNNGGERISVYNAKGDLVFTVIYKDSWYQSIEKNEGGWSLEMIDIEYPHLGFVNWKASIDESGGTPGRANSVKGSLTDFEGPMVFELTVQSYNSIQISFDEPLMDSTAVKVTNYVLNHEIENPNNVIFENDSIVILQFEQRFSEEINYGLLLTGIKDVNNNSIADTAINFNYQASYLAKFGDLLITEIFADPNPQIDLPDYEFLEIYNSTSEKLLVFDMSLAVGEDSVLVPEFSIDPDEYLVLCQSAAHEQFMSFGNVLSVPNWPTLNNRGDRISLYNVNGDLVFTVDYDDSWYQSIEKDEGGWSLEMIDTNYPCKGKENWKASDDPSGGTPGRNNSSSDAMIDLKPPELSEIIVTSDKHLLLKLNEVIPPTKVFSSQISIDPALDIDSVVHVIPDLDKIQVFCQESILENTEYTLTLKNIEDCAGNHQSMTTGKFIRPSEADSLDVIINEVLFNPWPDGVDFIEVYNKSDKYIDLADWTIANKDTSEIVRQNFVLEPKKFLVLTEDYDVLNNHYPGVNRDHVLEVDHLSPLNDDEGKVVLMDGSGRIIDFFEYSEEMHSPFLRDPEGVSLERISFDSPTNNPDNWQSAAESAGFATPGRMNSQFFGGIATGTEEVMIEPKVFDPGSNTANNFTLIKCRFDQPGYMASIKVLDASGREVKSIANHQSVGAEEDFKWEGENDNGEEVRMGSYIVYLEVYNATGIRKIYQKRVVVGGR